MARLVIGTDKTKTTPAVVKEVGITPVGTLNITTNGTYDVTTYVSAEVNTPAAPASYIPLAKDANNELIHSTTSTYVLNLDGATSVGANILLQAFQNNTAITGALNFSSLLKIDKYQACQAAFFGCTGLTSVNMHNVKTINNSGACQNMFSGCTGITSVDLGSLQTMEGSQCADSMFKGCTSLTTVYMNNFVYLNGSAGSMFNGCTALTKVDFLPKFAAVGGGSASGFSSAFSGCTGLTQVDLSGLVWLKGNSACSSMFYRCTNLASVNISHLARIGTSNQMQTMFRNCTSLTSLSFPNLAYTATNFNAAFPNMLQGVTGCTVHFPAEWQTAMSTWSNVTGGFGGTNTTVLFDLPNVTTLDLSCLVDVVGLSMFSEFASSNYFPNITSVNLSNLKSITAFNGCLKMFMGSTGITSVDLSSLETVSNTNAMVQMFDGCTGLTTLSFPALKSVDPTSMQNMIANTSNITVHFPSNLSTAGITAQLLGGTNTTVLFDLPATE